MNPTTAEAPPPQLIQPHRPSTSCDRHPEENFTGFCPSCLCERLAVLDPSTSSSSASASASRKPPTSSTAAAALRAIFKPPIGGGSTAASNKARPSTSFFPELRRTKSFSASKNEGFSGVFEPQRKSCDVRVRNTLWNLFHQDDGRNPNKRDPPTATTTAAAEVEVETRSLQAPVFESKEEEEDEIETEISDDEDRIEIRDEPIVAANVIEERVPEILEEEEEEEEKEAQFQPPPTETTAILEEEELKPMKDHLDLDSQTKKKIAGSFWSAASVFSKKLQKWRQKQKLKKRRSGGGSATLPVEKPIGRQFRETQSEIADYGFGRRSCDTDPRFSLDAGRVSFDDPRYSFDEPRASWDGYLIGRTFPRMPTMLSVVEDAPAVVHVPRCDAQIPVEEPPPMNPIEEEAVPGGSAQTRDYYSDSTTRRRKSLDRSNSIRKTAAAVVAEIDEMKSSASNAKVSPPTAAVAVPERVDLRDFYNSNSMRDDCSEAFETGSFRGGDGERSKGCKKSRRWSKAWNIWSFIHRRGGNKDEDEDRYSASVRGNGVVERSFSESWPELRGGDRNGEVVKGFNPKIMRSNSSASWRNGSYGFGGGSFGSMRKSNGNAGVVEANGNGGKKKKDDHIVLERNRSARYSPNHADPGMLRFYLTPMRSSWRSGTRSNPAHSIARSVLRLY